MQANNAEKFLHRAVDSIRSQTYTDFFCWICDNHSTDSTYEIIKKYAQIDSRIIPLSNEKVDPVPLYNQYMPILLNSYPRTVEWFCILDADDEYSPDFLENMLTFITNNNLDIATCGTDWIDEKDGQVIKHKVLDKNLILEGQDFAELFPIYRNYMVTAWGAMYSLDLLQKCNFEWSRNAMNFSDTAFCMEAFQKSKRAGVLGKKLHKYYISPKTGSYSFRPDWFKACKYLHKISIEYLHDYGAINKQNEHYLYVLFLILIKYILPRIQNANVNFTEKLKILGEILTDGTTQYMLIHWNEVGIYSNKSDFLLEIEQWIYAQPEWDESRSVVEEIMAALNSGMKG